MHHVSGYQICCNQNAAPHSALIHFVNVNELTNTDAVCVHTTERILSKSSPWASHPDSTHRSNLLSQGESNFSALEDIQFV